MALTVAKMIRTFEFSGIRLPDPNPAMSVDEVKALYYTKARNQNLLASC